MFRNLSANAKKWSFKKLCLLQLLMMGLLVSARAQSYQRTEHGLKVTVDSMDIEVQCFGSDILRVLKSPHGTTWKKASLSVIKKAPVLPFALIRQPGELILKTEKIQVTLDLQSGKLSFSTAGGQRLLDEKAGGVRFLPFNDSGASSFTASQAFILDKDEPIYGLGQHQRGKMSQRNQVLRLAEDNTEDGIPFFQSIKGYGLFWDNYSRTTFTDKADSTSFSSEVGDCVDYYFMYGGDADGVIARMRELTGQAPMMPLWTFGYWQSRERYKSQDEIVGVVKKYRDLQVPLDGIVQDWQYWGDNYHWNAMEFLNPEFPDPRKMVDDIHRMNAHAIISAWASFGPKTEQYRIMNEKGMLLNFKTWPLSGKDVWPPDMNFPSGVRVYDPFNPEARDIYWRFMNKGLFSINLDGWWLDSSEPDHLESKPADFDDKTYLGSYRKVCNAYPLMTVGGVYDHQRATSSAKRVFILTRSAFAGQQRYGANTWSGDVFSSWQAFKNQISTGLNFSLSGIPYWNSDIGGFFLSKFPGKLNDPEYRELYVRWLEFGTFCPMMRSHGTDAPREIYQFGRKGDRDYDAIEKFINLRYRLLPYIYSVSREVTAHQSSMMRALMMDFPKDRNVWDINDQFLFGKSLLVAPVTRPMYVKRVINGKDSSMAEDFSTTGTRETYLPDGSSWYDFWTGEELAGGKKVSSDAPFDIIPLYVKAGSLLPIGPQVQYAAQKKWDDLEIRVYPGADGKFLLYEDENDNYNYEKGVYSTIPFSWNDATKTLTIGDRKGAYPGMLARRKFNILLVNPGKGHVWDKVETPDRVIVYTGNKIVSKF